MNSFEPSVWKTIKQRFDGPNGAEIRHQFMISIEKDLEKLFLVMGGLTLADLELLLSKKRSYGSHFAAIYFLNHFLKDDRSANDFLTALEAIKRHDVAAFIFPERYEQDGDTKFFLIMLIIVVFIVGQLILTLK